VQLITVIGNLENEQVAIYCMIGAINAGLVTQKSN